MCQFFAQCLGQNFYMPIGMLLAFARTVPTSFGLQRSGSPQGGCAAKYPFNKRIGMILAHV
jgi:hypothetical protein